MNKITFQTAALKEAVSAVISATTNQLSDDLTGGLYLYVSSTRVMWKTSDSRLYLIHDMNPATFSYNGSSMEMVFPGRKMAEIISKLSDPQTLFTFKDQLVHIKCGSISIQTTIQHGDLFPKTPQLTPQAGSFTIASDVLAYMYRKTSYAIAKTDQMPILGGLHHKLMDKQFQVIACDRQRISIQQFEWQAGDQKPFAVTVPELTIQEIKKQLGNNQPITISFDEKIIVYQLGRTYVMSHLLAGTYPDAGKMIPSSLSIGFEVNTKLFKQAISRAALFYENGQQVIHLIVNPSTNQLRILSNKSAWGQLKEDLYIQKSFGDNLAITTNLKYWTDLISLLPYENIRIEMNGKLAPIVVRGVGEMQQNVDLLLPTNHAQTPESIIDDFELQDDAIIEVLEASPALTQAG